MRISLCEETKDTLLNYYVEASQFSNYLFTSIETYLIYKEDQSNLYVTKDDVVECDDMKRKISTPQNLNFDGGRCKRGFTMGVYLISPSGERTLSSFTSNLHFQTMKQNMKNLSMG